MPRCSEQDDIPGVSFISSVCGRSRNLKTLDDEDGLDVSRMFVDRLLGTAVSGLTPGSRIEALRLLNPSEQQITDLERFLRSAATKPLLSALAELADKKHLWVNALRIEGAAQVHSEHRAFVLANEHRQNREMVGIG